MLCCSQGMKKETGTLEGSTRTQMITYSDDLVFVKLSSKRDLAEEGLTLETSSLEWLMGENSHYQLR